jgi:hypothetical protein
MRFCRLGELLAGMFLMACSLRPLSSSEGGEVGSSGESDTGTIDESDSGTTGEEFEPCTCVEGANLNFSCDEATLNDCDVPSPCGLVNLGSPDADVATCVLQLLVDQEQPSQFDYYVSYDGGFESWEGTFYILGPGIGTDLECHNVDFSHYLTPAAYAINEPAYFQDCLGKTASVMTGCIFNGLTAMELVAACAEN